MARPTRRTDPQHTGRPQRHVRSQWSATAPVGIDMTSTPHSGGRATSAAAKRWADLWTELDFTGATLLGQARRVEADRYGPRLELIPQLYDLHHGRRFISIGIKYDTGPGRRREIGSVAFGQFLNLPFADWAVADQLWGLLQTGDLGVSFNDLDVINGNFDRATKAMDQFEKDRWIQQVFELKVRLEGIAKKHTQEAVRRIATEVKTRPGARSELVRTGISLPSVLLESDPDKEAQTRFRINQGMYGDHTLFVDRPEKGEMTVHGIPPGHMFRRAEQLYRDLTRNWLGVIRDTLEELIDFTSEREGTALARAIEGAEVTRKLNVIVGTFWSMWGNPIFSANADFEVVTDHERRAAKYMDIMIQRTLRVLLKQAVEEIGLYPYTTIDRFNYRAKIRALDEALARTGRILKLYAQARSVPAFYEANKERDRLVREFLTAVMEHPHRS
jgi:hypothetical protein